MSYLIEKIFNRVGKKEKEILHLILNNKEKKLSVKEIKDKTNYSGYIISTALKDLYKIGIVDRVYINDLQANRNLEYKLDITALENLQGE